jgi:hypothetical protein
MRRVCLSLVFILALAGFGQEASASVITFNEAGLVPGYGPSPYYPAGVKGTSVANQFASLGVLFTVAGPGAAYVSSAPYTGAVDPSVVGNYLAFNTVPYTSKEWATLSATFVDPLSGSGTTVSGFSATVMDGNVDQERMKVRAFDIYGNQLETFTLTSLTSTFQFVSTNIGRIDFIDTGGDGHVIDNFKFTLNKTPVPEPASMSLFAIGGAVLTLARKRRRQ